MAAPLYAPFPVLLRGLAATGEAFQVRTLLDNVSAGGLYVRLPQRLVVGVRMFALIALWRAVLLARHACM